MISAITDKNPVIVFEHRWLHEVKDFVSKKYYKTKLGKAEIIKEMSVRYKNYENIFEIR